MEVFSPSIPGMAGALQAEADQLTYKLPDDPFDRSQYLEACERLGATPAPDSLLQCYWLDDLRTHALSLGSNDLLAAVLLADGRAAQLAQAQMLGRLPISPRQGSPRRERLTALAGSDVPWLAELADDLLTLEMANV